MPILISRRMFFSITRLKQVDFIQARDFLFNRTSLPKPVADPGFSPGGRQLPKWVCLFIIFAENCMKMKEFGPGGVSLAPPLDPPMQATSGFRPEIRIQTWIIFLGQVHDLCRCHDCCNNLISRPILLIYQRQKVERKLTFYIL